jgi:hypothetical protein
MVTVDYYERLLEFLAFGDAKHDSRQVDDDLDQVVAETAYLMADLRAASGDRVGSAVWQQVANSSGHAAERVNRTTPPPDPWSAVEVEPEISYEGRAD